MFFKIPPHKFIFVCLVKKLLWEWKNHPASLKNFSKDDKCKMIVVIDALEE